MKKVLIISYYFPPGNFAGSYRIKSWENYLPKFKFYPIVVTRHWDKGDVDFTGISEKGNREIVKTDSSEIHYLPYRGSFRDRLIKYSKGHLTFVAKFLSLFEIVLQNFFLSLCPYKNLYEEARSILKADQSIDFLIVSGRPFYLFKFAHLLKKEFPWIEWVADYRDPWSTNSINKINLKMRFLSWVDRPFEKKWIKNAHSFTTCSSLWVKQINDFTGIPGVVILNGFDPALRSAKERFPEKNKVFSIVYNGTLYENQRIEIFLKGFKDFVKNGKGKDVKLIFAGAGSDPANIALIKKLSRGIEDKVQILPKIEQKKLFELLVRSHLNFLSSYEGEQGRFTAKIFDYLISGNPTILCPSDKDVMEALIQKTKAGFIANSSKEVTDLLRGLYLEWESKGSISYIPNWNEIDKYSREGQTKILAEHFNRVKEEVLIADPEKILHCPLCLDKRFEIIPGYQDSHLSKCKNCGFVFSEINPSAEVLQNYYETYFYNDEYYSSPLTALRYQQLLEKFEPYRRHNRILDVGCGNGDFLEAARKKGWECWGTEYSEEAVRICKQKGLNVIQGELQEVISILPEFDVITSIEVLEHINKPKQEITLINGLLRESGLFYLTTPNFNALIRFLLGSRYDVIKYPEHLTYYTTKTLDFLLTNNGFRKKKVKVTGFSLSRFKNGLLGKKENPFSPDSLDERLRITLESNPFFRGGEAFFDWLFTITSSGLSLKGWYEKKSDGND